MPTPSLSSEPLRIRPAAGYGTLGQPWVGWESQLDDDRLPPGVSEPYWYDVEGTTIAPTYDGGLHRLTWSDAPASGQEVTIHYAVNITTDIPQALVNSAMLEEEGGPTTSDTATVLANPYPVYLPLTLKND